MNLLAAILLLGGCLPPEPPAVAVLIDDVGYRPAADHAAVALHGPYALAILPGSADSGRLARLGAAAGKEVLLHMPMEATSSPEGLGSPALRESMTPAEIAHALHGALAQVPGAIGLNNHMGSMLTAEPAAMRATMRVLRETGTRFFIDSRTTPETVAATMAGEAGIAVLSRDVFLDHEVEPEAIAEALRALAARAHAQGYALAIGHPHPETLAALAAWSPARAGVTLVSLQELLARRIARERGSTLPAGAQCEEQRPQSHHAGDPGEQRHPIEIEQQAVVISPHHPRGE